MPKKVHLPAIAAVCLTMLLSWGCSSTHVPRTFFDPNDVPPAPNYTQLDHWVAHPDLEDMADGIPVDSLEVHQEDGPVDVFFIHPTTYNNEEHWNADVDDAETNEKTATSTIRHQASIFNGVGRIYAPRYRQMTYPAFFTEGEQRRTGFQALVIAYQDVLMAFDHYLANENQGRPFIIASHSQGSCHAIKLLQDRVDGKPLADQLVTAYVVGWPVFADSFQVLEPCSSPDQTGCYNTWCSYKWDYTPENYDQYYAGAVCTNPVTWQLNEEPSAKEDHHGGVLRRYKGVYPEALEAKVNGSILWVTKPDVPGKAFITFKNYHIADYNLFWLDVRHNAALRVEKYMETH